MKLVIESWALALCGGVAAVGYGSALGRWLRIRPNLGDRGILGLLAIGFLGCLLHFGIALSTPVQAAVLAAGVSLAAIRWREIRTEAALGFLAAAGLSIFALLHWQAVPSYDNGLYHFQTFKWNHQFPIVLGIANLHCQLAYNSLLFLIAPLTDRIGFGWITNFLAATFVLLSLWARLRGSKLADRRSGVQFWFIALAFCSFNLNQGSFSWFGILFHDSIVAVLEVYWVALALGFAESSDRRTDLALLILSAVLAMTVKISAIPLLIITLGFVLFHRKDGAPGAARACALGGGLLAAWMLRSILLSGCAVYPVPQTRVPWLSWAVSASQVKVIPLAIRAWARSPGEPDDYMRALRDWSWFPHWAGIAVRNHLILLLLGGCLVGSLAVAFAGKRLLRGPRDDLILIGAGLAVSLAFWFWSAPDPRFARGFIFAAAILGFSLAGAAWLHDPRVYSRAPQVLTLVMVLWGFQSLLLLAVYRYRYYPSPPDVAVYQIEAPHGVGVWVPREGDQCWAHELPCTPYVDNADLARVHWPVAWPYRHDPNFDPPKDWTPIPMVPLPHRLAAIK